MRSNMKFAIIASWLVFFGTILLTMLSLVLWLSGSQLDAIYVILVAILFILLINTPVHYIEN